MPTLDEVDRIGDLLAHLGREVRPDDEVIVVDGGSRDGTREAARRAAPRGTTLLRTEPGRSRQEAAAVARAAGEVILFLHADTRLPPGGLELVRRAVRDGADWGWFPARLEARGTLYRCIERGIAFRTRVFLGSPTGDQALWVRGEVLRRAGGIPRVPLAHELRLVRRLRRAAGRGRRLPEPVRTSARRWTEVGPVRTTLLQWAIRLGCELGVSPAWARRFYRAVR